ncbi:MAG: diguanylate cyclase [Candidatus Delongbacteria bacterium]|nr:diguanylate cyclase [Candidatus Delongbacteria bacterium]
MPENSNELCLLVCERFKRETERVLQLDDFSDVSMRIDSNLGKIIRNDIQPAGSCFSKTIHSSEMVICDGCLSKPDPLLPDIHYSAGRCLDRLAGQTYLHDLYRQRALVISPGWLANWKHELRAWNLTSDSIPSFFSEHFSKLVLLDTGVDPESNRDMAVLADYLNLPSQIVPIGLDHFTLVLNRMVMRRRLDNSIRENRISTDKINRRLTEQAAALEMLVGLTHIRTEEEVIDQILNLFIMFAPQQVIYASILDGQIINVYSNPVMPPETIRAQAWLKNLPDDDERIENDNSFMVSMVYQDQRVGLLRVQSVAFPEYIRDYRDVAISLAKLCSLAIANSRLFQRVQQLAITDPLTGLFNRRHFFELSGNEFGRTRRYDRSLAAMMLDIDHFKKVNDRYGHAVGDQVLIEVTRCCRQQLRDCDIFGRYGGEEFVILMPETSLDHAMIAAERLRSSVSNLEIHNQHQVLNVTISLGVAMLNPECRDLEELLDWSDRGLYQAKNSGRNRVCLYDPFAVSDEK